MGGRAIRASFLPYHFYPGTKCGNKGSKAKQPRCVWKVYRLVMSWPMEIIYSVWLCDDYPIQICDFYQNMFPSNFYTKIRSKQKICKAKLDEKGFGWKPHFWNQGTLYSDAGYMACIGQVIAYLWTLQGLCATLLGPRKRYEFTECVRARPMFEY